MCNNAKSISVIISVRNGGLAFRACLASLARHRKQFGECIVADDGSTDGALAYAKDFGARVLRVDPQRGPANGRNAGALAATGSILLFLDADVSVHEDTIARIRKRFEKDPELGALFGSYDAEPEALGLVSQFRNLLHFFVHQSSNSSASTFWTGCGAIRREIFLENRGFDISFSIPCIEDIELGTRLVRNGVKIALDPAIQVKHLKRWTFRGMVVTDIRDRGIPWTRLILKSRRMPNDLNLRSSSRASVALTGSLYVLSAPIAASLFRGGGSFPEWWQALTVPLILASVIVLNAQFYRFLASRRSLSFAAACGPLQLVYFSCCALSFIIGASMHCYCWVHLFLTARRPEPWHGGVADDLSV